MKKKLVLSLLAFVFGFSGFYLGYLGVAWILSLMEETADYSWVPNDPLPVPDHLEVSSLASIGRTNFYRATAPALKGLFYGIKSTTTITRRVQRSELPTSPPITPSPATKTTFTTGALALDVPMPDVPKLERTDRIAVAWVKDKFPVVQKAVVGVLTNVLQAPATNPTPASQQPKASVPVLAVPMGQEAGQVTQEVQQLPNPVVAVQWALQDATSIPPNIARQRRYLWCPNASREEHAAAAFVINSAVSRSSVDVIPTMVANGALVAIDLRLCAPDEEEYQKLLSLWERYGNEEPYFHVPGRFQVKVKPYKAKDGKTYESEWRDGYVRAPYLGQAIIDLETATGSFCPILRVDQWLQRSLDTVDGGLYYELRGLEVGKTKLDDYLVSRGASREQAKRTRADEKAIFMSEVTDKARVVTMFPTASTRLSVGLGMAAITDDPFDETDQADFDPFRNFLESKTNGHEVFVTLPSGWIEYSIWDADGNLVKEAPPNLVADHRIPEPHTRRLQGAISCIRCHAPTDMWQPFTNEVAAMLSNQGANVFGDLKGGKKQDDTLQRLAGLYSGDLTEVLTLARNAFARRVFAVCRMEADQAAGAVAKVYNDYVYTRVTAKTACRELGIIVPDDDQLGVDTFKSYVPPLPALDDPIIGRLQVSFLDINRKAMRGLTLTRRQWEQVYADAFIRMEAAKNPNLAKTEKDKEV